MNFKNYEPLFADSDIHNKVNDFVNQNKPWLIHFVRKFNIEYCTIDEVYSECLIRLPKILSTYNYDEPQCNIRTFVANRLRGYLKEFAKTKMREQKKDLEEKLLWLTSPM